MGRTGKLFAHEHFGIVPDIMTLAKALANGLPIGAMLAREDVASAFTAGSHATTFGGTPAVTAAALETVRTMEEERLVERCARIGAYFLERLKELQTRHPVVKEVRGMGLMLAMELEKAAEPLVGGCLERGFLVNCVQEKVLRFVPPLVIEKQEIDALVASLDEILPSL
jgi:acetylornithine aminotransferase